ncbi:MAG TPA: thioredoxin family protein [Candidatus Babeliales bacterium]|nr:thioredoxin family protein [Candidatus Babeliales bacterium]
MKNNLRSQKFVTLSVVLLLASFTAIPEISAKHHTDSSKAANSGKIKAIGSIAELETTKAQAKTSNKVVAIKFFSPSCSHCHKVAPAYSKLANQADYDHVIFTEINAPANRDIAQKYSITAYPTFVILDRNGAEAKKIRGANIAAVEAALAELK